MMGMGELIVLLGIGAVIAGIVLSIVFLARRGNRPKSPR